MKKYHSRSLTETSTTAKELLGQLAAPQKNPNEATVVGLSGHLGAAKTAFVKAIAKHLGIVNEVTSPTFVIMKIYPINHAPWQRLVHIDAYRLESGKEVEALDFEKVIADRHNLVFIEWPENIKEALEGLSNYSRITFEVGKADTERIITRE
jgi:tRNA threonylcarbamoyladenosine biosynthesis protein TsaE